MNIIVSIPVIYSMTLRVRKRVGEFFDSSSAAQFILDVSNTDGTTTDAEIIIEGETYMFYPDDDTDPICGSWPAGEGDDAFKSESKIRIDYLLEFHEAFYVE